jgi:hypothetical protein
MPGAIDRTGARVDLPPDALAAAWQAGDVDLVGGEKYHVRTPQGEYHVVPAESLHQALGQGAKLVSEADVASHHEEQEYGGIKGHAIALGAGALEQGTLGVGSELLPESWHAPIEASKRQNPLTYGAGQVAGAVGLSAVLPGGGAAGLVEKLGAGAVEGVGEATMARIAARATLGAARASAEGAQFGAAKAISDNAIADHQLTAAQMLGEIKSNALWGGALGAVGGALGAVARRGAEAFSPEETVVGRLLARGGTDADVASVAAKAVGAETPAEGLGPVVRKWYSKLAGAVSGGKAEDIENVLEHRAELLDAERVREDAASDIRSHVDTVLKESDAIQDQYKGSLKRGHLKVSTAGVEPAAAAQASRSMADRALTALDEMAKNPDDYGAPSAVKKTIRAAEKYSKQLDAAIASNDVAEQYGLVDDIKRAIGRPAKIAARLDSHAAATEWDVLQNRARAKALDGVYEDLRRGLEDESVWQKAATDQQAINRAWTTHIDASSRFHKALTTEGARGLDQGFGRNPRIVDPEKVDSYVRNLINPAKDLTHQAVEAYVDSAKTLSGIMGQSLTLSADEAAGVSRIASSADAFGQTLDKVEKSLTLQNQFEALRNATVGHAQNWGAVAGAVAHGLSGVLPGMALGKAAQMFTRPADAIMHLARVEQMMRSSDNRVVKALRGFAGGRPATGSARSVAGDYARKSAQVRTVSANPDLLQERVAANLGSVHGHAPKLANALTMTSLAGLAILRDKMPQTLLADPLNPEAKPPGPSPAQQAEWLRYYDAVRDPVSVIEDLRAGRLSTEGIEVLKTVYPPLFGRIQNLTMQEMASGRMRDLTAQQRLGLGMMLDLPIPELDPAYIAEGQAAYAQGPQPPAGSPKPGPKRRPVDLVKKAAAPALASDRIEGAR